MKPQTLLGVVAFVMSVGTASAGTLTFNVVGSSNPFLAGMPNGSTVGSDSAPAHSPVEVTGFALDAGDILTFAVTGSVSFTPNPSGNTPDGGSNGSTSGGAINGISPMNGPFNSLLGVFLTDAQPNLSPAPAGLNFSSAASRDFTSLSPLLKQTFFIGDGLTSTAIVQQFVVPTGATRLFLGTHDGFGWFNNSGSFTVDVTGKLAPSSPVIPLPAAGWLLLGGIGGLGALVRRRRQAA